VKKQTKLFALIGAVVASAVALSGCAYQSLNIKISATADGDVDLSTYKAEGIGGIGSAAGDRTVPRKSTGTAKIKLSRVIEKGNINVSGSYSDGDVRFTFSGTPLTLISTVVSSMRTAADSELDSYRSTTKGGECIPVITNYQSTNSRLPGTGIVIFRVCDAPGSSSSPEPQWTEADYLSVYIPMETSDPSATSSDANPFGNYLSGGYVTGSRGGSGTSVSVTLPSSTPTFTPTPLFPAPSSAPTLPPVPGV
jgi:hypothetical protein